MQWFLARRFAYGLHPPSGHSAAVCGVAVILWTYLPIIRVFCAATVAAILAALVAGDFHFLSDVIAGAFEVQQIAVVARLTAMS